MGSVIIVLLVLIGIVVGVALYCISIFNHLVSLKNQYINAFSNIDVQLKRRYDLIPNLVTIAKEYMSHERETLEAVINARNAASNNLAAAANNPGDATLMADLAGAEGALSAALGKLSVVVESYPELKANENMQQLSTQLTETENIVANTRQNYNDMAMAYNINRQTFPNSVIANMFGHAQDATMLTMPDSAEIQNAPEVNF